MRIRPAQELVHWLEVGRGAGAIRLLVAALVLLALTWWYDLSQARNFAAPEAMEAAQLARNLARGEGFTTQVVRPLTLQWVQDRQGVEAGLGRRPHPDLFNPPFYPLVLAGWMRLLPFQYPIGERFWRYQPELLITILNQLLFFASVALAARLAGRLMGREAGWLLALLLLASELLWRFSASGLSTMLALLLTVGLLDVLVRLEAAVREDARRGAGWFLGWGAGAGLLLGLLGLTRYSGLVLVLPVTAFIVLYLGRRALPVLLITWVVGAAVMVPWLMRNERVSGTWFGVPGQALYAETARFPGDRLERSFQPDLSLVETSDVIQKGVEGLRDLLRDDLLRLGGGWFGAFVLVGLLGQYREPAVRRLRLFVLLSLAALAVAQTLGRTHLSATTPTVNTENLLVLLTPGLFLLGVAFYRGLLERFELPFPEFRHFLSAILVAGMAAPLLLGVFGRSPGPVVYPPYYPPHLQQPVSLLKSSEVLMSDMPWATAWYGDRTSVWTTLDAQDAFYQVNDEHHHLTALLLSPLTMDAPFRRDILQGRSHDWARLAVEVLLRTNVPTGFPLRYAWSPGIPDHLFLADLLLAEREGWLQPASP